MASPNIVNVRTKSATNNETLMSETRGRHAARRPYKRLRAPFVNASVAITWFSIMAVAGLLPALLRGVHFATYGLLGLFGLGSHAHVALHNVVASDQIQEMAPWSVLAWRAVHAGHIPLWNPYSAMGLPLAFNFQSAVFSLPMLIAYMFPVGLAYTVTFFVKMIIAGTGAFYLARILKANVAPSLFAGTIFELSGALTGWLGWAQAGTFCWLGWILGSGLLVVTTRRRGPIAVFAISLAFAIYGGHPEATAISGVVVVLILGSILVKQLIGMRSKTTIWATARLAAAAMIGVSLAAPLLLPGAQLVARSVRSGTANVRSIPSDGLVNLAFSSFYGLPSYRTPYFGPANYYEMAAYVGLIALVLSIVAFWEQWRRVEIQAIVGAGIALSLIVYTRTGAEVMGHIPVLRDMVWTRSIVAINLLLSILAGLGLHVILTARSRTTAGKRLLAVSVCGLLSLLLVFLISVGKLHTSIDIGVRNNSFVWPAVSAVSAVAAALILVAAGRTRRRGSQDGPARNRGPRWATRAPVFAAVLLAGVEIAFLLTATPGVEPSSPVGFVATHAEKKLKQVVGTARVGFASCPSLEQLPSLGILPEANDVYRVSEISAYDPIIPKNYVVRWDKVSGAAPEAPAGTFCPSISNAARARLFGVAFVLASSETTAPRGAKLVGHVGTEVLYHVPSAGVVTLSSKQPIAGLDKRSVGVNYGSGDGFQINVQLSRPRRLAAHITAVPGWSATVDGRPLALRDSGGLVFTAHLPAGRDRVAFRYWPRLFTVGLVLAALAFCAIVIGGVVSSVQLRGNESVPKRKAADGSVYGGTVGDGRLSPALGGDRRGAAGRRRQDMLE